jgi:putative transposase
MPRRLRAACAGFVYHVLNRGVGRATLFDKSLDYAALEKVLRQAHDRFPTRLLAYVAMPNHWHLVAWPTANGELSEYLRWVTVTHTQRWHAHHHTAGTGPLYQGRFKSFPIQEGEHLLAVRRYVERNPLRAGLVAGAEQWRWSSLWHRVQQTNVSWLADGPEALPTGWLDYVNGVETEAELAALRKAVVRGCPYGEAGWQERTAAALGLEASLRPVGRPRKATEESGEV